MIAALITARGQHVGIKDNPLLPILGRPVLVYPYLAVRHAASIEQIFLSSDGEETKSAGRNLGIEVIDRPVELSVSEIGHLEVIRHALEEIRRRSDEPELLVVMLGNVATHETGIVDKCVEILVKNPHVDSCVTVSERNEFHPLRAKRLAVREETKSVNGLITEIEPYMHVDGIVSTNRQDLEPVYFLNHAVWVLRPLSCFESNSGQWPGAFTGDVLVGVETDHGIDIRTMEDVAFSEHWLISRGWTMNQTPYWSE